MPAEKIHCLIVDDEPLSLDILKDYVEACPELILEGVCFNALEAGGFLRENNIGLLFLDINMPLLSGVNFIKSLPNPPLVVFVSAYPEYAIEGFEVDAVDYLLKPVSFGRFRKAVNRVAERLESRKEQPLPETGHLMAKADKKSYRVGFDELLYLEAMGDYVKFRLPDKKLMVHGTLKDFLQQLPATLFMQVHKSFIINLRKVSYIEGNQVKLGDEKIPVSLTFRDELFRALNKKE